MYNKCIPGTALGLNGYECNWMPQPDLVGSVLGYALRLWSYIRGKGWPALLLLAGIFQFQ